jgi:predicted flavoprotein YhiN
LTGKGHLLSGEQGELLFTHFGLSGPVILSASANMRAFGRETYHILIDLKRHWDEKKLDARILRDFSQFANREFRNALERFAAPPADSRCGGAQAVSPRDPRQFVDAGAAGWLLEVSRVSG